MRGEPQPQRSPNVAELTRNDVIRERIRCCIIQSCDPHIDIEIRNLALSALDLRAEVERLRKDAERLDLAEQNPAAVMILLQEWWDHAGIGSREDFFNFRGIIDAALAAKEPRA